ncbi:MAG: hypothetical protein WCV93_00805 [Candidatus Shapirobacteria bacterium]|jgi:hypothetical protein
MTKLQITLTPAEATSLSFLASRFGYDITRYVKYLISKSVDSVVSQRSTHLSTKADRLLGDSLAQYQQGKLSSVDSVDELFDL